MKDQANRLSIVAASSSTQHGMAATSNKRSFDPREFLAKAGEGKTIIGESPLAGAIFLPLLKPVSG